MKQIVITKAGGPEVLQLKEVKTVNPKPAEVQIDVRAAGVNFADILARKGMYPDAPKIPCVVGYEVAGVVSAIGENVDSSWMGKEVLALTRFHGYADTVNVPVSQVYEKPQNLSFEQAAAIPVVYVTAWQLLVSMGGLKPGETVLVHNAGGGVGLAALDIIKHIGGRAIGTASAGKHNVLKERGYDNLIDYRTQDWFDKVMKHTDNKGVELIIDPIGGEHWKKSYKALRATGRLGMFGISSATEASGGRLLGLLKVVLSMPKFSPISLMNDNRSVFGVNLGHMWHEPEMVRVWFEAILNGAREGWIRPHVDKVIKFEEAAQAHQYIEDRKNIGKVILTP